MRPNNSLMLTRLAAEDAMMFCLQRDPRMKQLGLSRRAA